MPDSMDGDLVARIAGLSPAKRALLDRRLVTSIPGNEGPSPSKRPAGPVPTSFGQRSQWFLQRLDPESSAFNTTGAVRVRGQLDIRVLERSVQMLIERHEVLRTRYVTVDGEPMQVVRDSPDITIPIVEVGGGRKRHLPLELHRLIAAERARPFDLANELMYRVALFRLGPDDHVLTRTTHHIAFDKWSAAIANRELSEIYAALASGRPPDLSPLPYQYSDFSVWQRASLGDAAIAGHLEFFTSHIAGAPQVFVLPPDHVRPTGHDRPGATYTETLPPEIVHGARALARREGATGFMVLLAAFATMLGRYGNQDQILIGVPVAGRARPDSEALIGLFINTLVLRMDLRDEPGFQELVSRVRAAALGAATHQDLPFERLVEGATLERPRDRSALFQVMFDYINTPGGDLRLAELELEPIAVGDDTSIFDLTLYVIDDGAGMKTSWEYRSDLFERRTIVRLARSFQMILAAAISAPASSIAKLPLLSGSERAEILEAGTAATGAQPQVSSVLDVFAAQVGRSPDAVAILDGGSEITYDDLSNAANRLAYRLRDTGAGRGARVGVLIERSPQMVTALLGVTLAGYVAVLLDPAQPPDRLAQMLDEADVGIVLSAGGVVPPAVAVHLDLDAEAAAIASLPGTPVAPELSVASPMYLVFTSGSTGFPKGVIIGHEAVANFISDAVNRYGIKPGDRVLQFSAPGFDTMIEEIFSALCGGACLVMRPPELFATFAEFARFVAEQEITVLDLPTAWWSAWVEEMERTGIGVADCVRLVIVGGEAVGADRWRTWRRIVGDRVRWVNTYGPAEATVVVATFEPPSRWPGPTGATVPIGRPITNARLVVVDDNGEPVPTGVPGELWIGGAPVAIGYVGDVDLTSDRFPRDPWHEGERMYRTGDLARLLADGTFEFLGRKDQQVKIRGTRVEPGEVEFALRRHPTVDEAAVVASGTGPDLRLVGHIVSRHAQLNAGELVAHLANLLPAAMIPTSWQFPQSLPLTTTGKIDRETLAARPIDDAAPESKLRLHPISDNERKLASMWESVLGRTAIGVDDNFFALGGHSLLGVRLIARVFESFAVDLPLRSIFDAPTVAEMAGLIDAHHATRAG